MYTTLKIKHLLKCIPLALCLAATAFALPSKAESKIDLTAGADLVSAYVWRGAYCGSASFQPAMTASIGGFSLGAWGSTEFTGLSKEFDLSASYTIKSFTLGFTDYWWEGQGSKYFDYKNNHYYEASLAYDFGEKLPLKVKWSTFLGGKDKDAEDKAQYSSYLEAAYSFKVKDLDCTAGIGVTPWKGYYADKAHVTDIWVKAGKTIKVSESLSIPFFVQLIAAPATDDTFLVAGISF